MEKLIASVCSPCMNKYVDHLSEAKPLQEANQAGLTWKQYHSIQTCVQVKIITAFYVQGMLLPLKKSFSVFTDSI